MNKSETRELNKLIALANAIAGTDSRHCVAYLARGYSALIRATRTTNSRDHMLDCAQRNPAVIAHPDFIIS
jgi:hypothetical protein